MKQNDSYNRNKNTNEENKDEFPTNSIDKHLYYFWKYDLHFIQITDQFSAKYNKN